MMVMSERLASCSRTARRCRATGRGRAIEIDEANWSRSRRSSAKGGGDLLGLWGEKDNVHLALRGAGEPRPASSRCAEASDFPSVGRFHAPAIRLERTIRDLYGFEPLGCRTAALARSRRLGLRAPLGDAAPPRGAIRPTMISCRRGRGLHQIPVGPVHAGIIEPGHFRFTVNGETVARLEERLGYVHKASTA